MDGWIDGWMTNQPQRHKKEIGGCQRQGSGVKEMGKLFVSFSLV